MSIRFKAFFLIATTLAGFVMSLFFINQQLLSNKVDSYESAQVLKEGKFLKNIIYNDIKSLNLLGENLISQSIFKAANSARENKIIEITGLDNVDFALITNSDGKKYQQYLSKNLTNNFGKELIFNHPLPQTPFLRQISNDIKETFIAGLYKTKAGTALTSAMSFINEKGELEVLILGRIIDFPYLSKIEQRTSYKLTILEPEERGLYDTTSPKSSESVLTTQNSVTLSIPFYDIYTDPIFNVELVINREIKENIQKILIQSIKYTVIFACLALLAILWFLHQQIILPLRAISRQMIAFRKYHTVPQNAYLRRHDEIGDLSREFINFVDDVGFFRRTLAETTYDISIIAVTQNIFHYLGKNFNKNLESLEQIQRELGDLTQNKLLKLQKKLTSRDISEEEKEKITLRFIGHSLKMATVPKQISEKIEHITSIMQRVLISTNKDLFSERPLLQHEEISLEELVNQAYNTLPSVTRENITFTTDLEISKFQAATLHRITLQFVLQEAIENSAQAIQRGADSENGLIKINSRYCQTNSSSTLEIDILDNGVGFSDENLDIVFTQKNTKTNSIGPGLSWCRTALKTMGGKLQIFNKFEDKQAGTKIVISMPIRGPSF